MRQLLSVLLVIINLLGFSPLPHTAPASANTNGELTWQIGDGVYLLDDYGISSAYLIVGSERALVIDAAWGLRTSAAAPKSAHRGNRWRSR
jgi:hypothetical protein